MKNVIFVYKNFFFLFGIDEYQDLKFGLGLCISNRSETLVDKIELRSIHSWLGQGHWIFVLQTLGLKVTYSD